MKTLLNIRTLIILLAALAFTSCARYKPENPNNSLLWEISGNGLKEPSYLYGTVHVADERVYGYGKVVEKSIKKCDLLTGELDFKDMGGMMSALMNMFLPSGTKLKDLYENEEDYALVHKKIVSTLGPLSGMADSLKPIFTSMFISQMESGSGGGLGMGGGGNSNAPLDMKLQQDALEWKMKVKGLETAEEQMAALDAISLKEQAEMLLSGIQMEETLTDEANMTEVLILTYLQQDIAKLDSLMSESGSTETFMYELLDKRNITMADRIDKLIQKRPTFNTFGAGHLQGKMGIISLLREKGYDVKPVYFQFNCQK